MNTYIYIFLGIFIIDIMRIWIKEDSSNFESKEDIISNASNKIETINTKINLNVLYWYYSFNKYFLILFKLL